MLSHAMHMMCLMISDDLHYLVCFYIPEDKKNKIKARLIRIYGGERQQRPTAFVLYLC